MKRSIEENLRIRHERLDEMQAFLDECKEKLEQLKAKGMAGHQKLIEGLEKANKKHEKEIARLRKQV